MELARWGRPAALALGLLAALPAGTFAQAGPGRAAGEPPRTILAHYMPWFEAKPTSPHWGWHWTMNAFDPEKITDDQRAIASHYHPLIGPYDSGDPDVLEYHALTMRLAGIDGVIIDWYGRSDHLDYAANHRHTAAFIEQAARARLKVAICYEDQTIPKLVAAGRLAEADRVPHARAEIAWLAENWFRSPAYLRVDGRPLLLSFGHDGLTDAEWGRALEQQADPPLYLSEHDRRAAAAGAFDWPVPKEGLKPLDAFEERAKRWPIALPVAFPRFHDIYEQARVQPSYGRIDDDGGKVFETTLDRALRGRAPLVQIATWNDWGEGTVIEPSAEFGYRDLETVQRLRKAQVEPGFPSSAGDLRLPLRLYRLRKAANPPARELDRIAKLLAERSSAEAERAMEAVEKARRAPDPGK